MRRVRALAGRSAVGQIIGSEKIGLGRIVKNVIAGVDARVKVRVDEARRNQTAFGVDLFVDELRIILTDELYPIAVEDDDTVFDHFMLASVEADDPTALDKCLHYCNLSDQ